MFMLGFGLGALLGGAAGFILMAALAMSDKPTPRVP